MSDFFKVVEDHIAIGRSIDAFNDRFVALCVRNWELGIRDKLTADTILARVQWWQGKLARGEVVPFRQARLRTGDILLGVDLATPPTRPEPICLPKNYFATHLLWAAATGAGKSTAQAHLASELAQAGVPTWQISCEKDDLRGQLPRCLGSGLQLVVLRICDLKLNPLEPGANEPRAHLTRVIARLERHLNLPPRAGLILQAVGHKLYRQFGLFGGRQRRSPTLFHAYQEVRNLREENAAAKDALLARLGDFLELYTPACGAWLKGWTPTDLAGFTVVFEFRTGGDNLKHFLVDSLLEHIFHHAVEDGALNSDLRLFVFVDDGQRMVTTSGAAGVVGLDRMIAILRSAGIGLGFLFQTPYGVSPYLLANTIIRFLGQMTDPDAWATMGRALNLNPAQLECAKSRLRPGRFAGIVTTGSWREPFLFEIPRLHLDAGVTDTDVLASQRPLEALPVEFAEEFRHWEPHPVVELDQSSGEMPTRNAPTLTPAEHRLLAAILAEPGKPAGYYAKKLTMNGRAARTAREHLVQLGLVREHRLQLRPKGKPALVLEPTSAPAATATGNVA